MFDYNRNLKKQVHEFPIFIEKGKEILLQIVNEFNNLNATPDSVCKLVDNDTKLLIKSVFGNLKKGSRVLSLE